MSIDVSQTNYLSPSGFKITISKENYPYLTFNSQQINHPSMDIDATEVGYRLGQVPLTGDRVTFGLVSIEALLDENMEVYGEVYNWMQRNLEVNHQLNSGVLYKQGDTKLSDYNDIRVQMLTNSNNPNREFVYRNAFPVTLGDIAFNATEESQFITCTIGFRFDYFEFI